MERKDMKAVLDSNRSVFWQGRLITSEAELPSVAELAAGDPIKEESAVADLQAQITALQIQLAQLLPSSSAEQQLTTTNDDGPPSPAPDSKKPLKKTE